MSGIRAVVPLKRLPAAKQRLAHLLTGKERHALMIAMLRDVLTALAASPAINGVVLVSREPEAAALAAEFGAEGFAETPGATLSDALNEAAAHLARRSVESMLILPGDVPLVSAADLARIAGGHRDVTLVPDLDGEGTNALLASPPTAITYRFDGSSFKPHAEAAYAAGITPRILRLSTVGLDIDTPDDLERLIAALATAEAGEHTRRWLAASGIASRPGGLHNSSLQS